MKASITFPEILQEATFVERPNRFIIRVRIEGESDLADVHLADPGRLKELLIPGNKVWVLGNNHPHRKTKWTAVLCENPVKEGYISINTTFPNQLIEIALKEGLLEEFSAWRYIRSEYTYGQSRWDFLLENQAGEQLLLEVKSVTLAENGVGMFPDAVTARGAKHVKELAQIVEEGKYQTAILFVAQRDDVEQVTTAPHIDPIFSHALAEASQSGVKLYGRACHITLEEIFIGQQLSVEAPIVSDEQRNL
ncbi:DNA/RNA nuclease SfsA [Cytobacillus spongiae]|uniref:DNA/RNA nuclease SfsA n=1 Tax=Cytobacillus spongiae TaxID=2901381 RepID=UPI001F1CA300|nr:DNA/RNA nuclease SfsA [Cytobacillus spongiae]UII56181.1 DNA/RNA nuclease SfsA [Cytobacillus spongiae]